MSNKPSIFNPDYNRLVLDPLTNRLITAGEIARRNAKPIAPQAIVPVAASKAVVIPKQIEAIAKQTVVPKQILVAAKAVVAPLAAAKPTVVPPAAPKPVAAPVAASKAVVIPVAASKPVAAPVAAPKPVAAGKPLVKEVKFDISASLNVEAPRYKGPLVIPYRGGYGAVTLGRGRR